MQLLEIDEVEMKGEIPVIWGTVTNEPVIVGQDIVLVSATGARELAMIAGVIPNYEGLKEFDSGRVGDAVKVIVHRKAPGFAGTEIVGVEKP